MGRKLGKTKKLLWPQHFQHLWKIHEIVYSSRIDAFAGAGDRSAAFCLALRAMPIVDSISRINENSKRFHGGHLWPSKPFAVTNDDTTQVYEQLTLHRYTLVGFEVENVEGARHSDDVLIKVDSFIIIFH